MVRVQALTMSIQIRNKCFSLISMVISLIIILILYYFLLHSYFGKSLLSKRTQDTLRDNNFDSSSPASIINKAKAIAADANKKMLKKNKQIDSILK